MIEAAAAHGAFNAVAVAFIETLAFKRRVGSLEAVLRCGARDEKIQKVC